MIRKLTLSVCTALTLVCAAGAASAQTTEYLSRKGAVPEVGSGDVAKSAATIAPGSGAATDAFRMPQGAPAVGPEAMIDGLAGIKHGRDGSDTTIEMPAKLQMMLKARGTVKPVKPGKSGKLVQIKNTKVSPYASIGMIMSGCTGALVMKRFVITAPWCVYDTKNKKFYENLDFVPALSGEDAPVGVVKWKNVWIPKGFRESGDLAYAFALIELDSDIGDQVGWFGFGPAEGSGDLKKMTLTGYPFAGVPQNTLWEATCNIDVSEQNAYFYKCPGDGKTVVSMLGSPFFAKGAKEGDAGQLLGIHVSSQNDKLDSWWAMRLNEAHTQTILAWANGGESPPDDPGDEDTGEDESEGEGEGEEDSGDSSSDCTCEDQASED